MASPFPKSTPWAVLRRSQVAVHFVEEFVPFHVKHRNGGGSVSDSIQLATIGGRAGVGLPTCSFGVRVKNDGMTVVPLRSLCLATSWELRACIRYDSGVHIEMRCEIIYGVSGDRNRSFPCAVFQPCVSRYRVVGLFARRGPA